MSEESIANIIKSCIVSRKGGMPLLEIEDEYRELVGQAIPFVSLGYKTLLEFINSISFVKVRRNYFGDSVLHVSDPKTAHIESLVNKQKNPSSRISNFKRNRKNRFAKGYQGGDCGVKIENTRGPEKFSKNTKMEYTKSKWYSNRAKDSWKDRRNESRALSRYNNFNSGRTTLPNSSNDSSRQNDNSWNGQITPYRQSSVEDNSYNFNSEQERSYAQESRSWQFQVRVGDANHNSTVGISQHAEYSYQQCQSGPFFPPRQFVGGPTNNYNNGWRDWCPPNYSYGPAPRDNQSGKWWPGLQGSANNLLPWMGGPQVPQIHPPPPFVSPDGSEEDATFNVDAGLSKSTNLLEGERKHNILILHEIALEPLINSNQLIGDDFLLQLALKNLRADSRKPRVGYGIECGLCISGQTIDECRQRLEKTEYLSGRITILLGAVDIFRGHSLEKMVTDMKKLLDVCRNRFNLSDDDITLCTIPPLANYSVRCKLSKLSVLYSFNHWISLHGNQQLDDSYVHHYNIVDLFSSFTDANYRTLYDYFETDARLVSGCSHPHVLWNSRGRRTAISMLTKLQLIVGQRNHRVNYK